MRLDGNRTRDNSLQQIATPYKHDAEIRPQQQVLIERIVQLVACYLDPM